MDEAQRQAILGRVVEKFTERVADGQCPDAPALAVVQLVLLTIDEVMEEVI